MRHFSSDSGKSFRVFLAFLIALCATVPVAAQESAPQLAPVNPEYLAYKAGQGNASAATRNGAASVKKFGHIPPQLDLSADAGKDISGFLPKNSNTDFSAYISPKETLSFGVDSSTYDLRDLSKLPPVRDQGNYGTCWAFAAMASLESGLLPSESWDFSENNMAMNSGYYSPSTDLMNAGGNTYMSSAYLLRWAGPTQESDDPYGGVRRTGRPVYKHLQEFIRLPAKASSAYNLAFIKSVKAAVVNYGAVAASFFWDDSASVSTTDYPDYYFYNSHCSISNGSRNCTYYSSNSGGHQVAIVGWDDNFSKTNFTTSIHGTPAGNGAWIARNSWGTGSGNGGYFYISYYDTSLGTDTGVFVRPEATNNYKRIYGYDTLGWVSSLGYGTTTAWMAMQTTAVKTELLKAVGFYTTESSTTTYQLFIYTNSTARAPRSGTLAYSTVSSFTVAGYHTLPLPTPLQVRKGSIISIVLGLTNTSYTYPLAFEFRTSATPQASASAGQTYYGENGNSWTDATSGFDNASMCLKAYTDTDPTSAEDLDLSTITVKGYPSPCNFKTTPRMTLGGLLNMQQNVKIRIYSLSGQLVRSFTAINGLETSNQAFWDGKNENGEKVASGVYIVVFTADEMEPKIEKVAVMW